MSGNSENVSINGVPVDSAGSPSPAVAAVRELLRQRAVDTGLIGAADGDEAVTAAIDQLLDREVRVPSASADECRRYYDSNRESFRSGDLVFVRHILFQVTPGIPLDRLRRKAERTLAAVSTAPEKFENFARTLSNCPSGQHGGNLGQIGRGETVPEFEQTVFGHGSIGILPHLVKTRYGFHIVVIDRRVDGTVLAFEAVRERIAAMLTARVQQTALRQYVSLLAGQAEIRGIDLDPAAVPLLQ
ncbi:MAG: peptidylprolyl isomerase [Alphaproteobacteria bacterium]|nr:peptidylprolyl isomerase [Alphaproteobacteria bacterium]